jgi:hypothetical protein
MPCPVFRVPSFLPAVGIVVVGQGTANSTGSNETAAVAERVARLCPGVLVELGYLEVIEPSIDAAVSRLPAEVADSLEKTVLQNPR